MPTVVGSVLYGDDAAVMKFVSERVPGTHYGFGNAKALGVIRNGKMVGGVVFHNFRGHDIEMSGAFDDPRWCLPQTLRTLFAYPFVQLGCARMTTITSRANHRARKIDKGLGFKLEGVIRKGWDGDNDALVFGHVK
jgi:RimJ/RimL family protein N-acetyltransferase